MNFDTTDKAVVDIEPQPSIWPVCIAPRTRNDPSPCETPFVRRIGLRWTTGRWEWCWSPDCKHKIKEGLVRFEYQEPIDNGDGDGDEDRNTNQQAKDSQ